jgi:hypothetical protein
MARALSGPFLYDKIGYMSPEKFLHTKDGDLQRSEDVYDAVEKQDRLNLARRHDILENTDTEELSGYKEELESLKRTPNTPEARIEAYLSRLENIFLNENVNKRTRNVELLKPYIHSAFAIEEGDVPESYWNLQRKVAREEGRDFPETISGAQMKDAFEKISEDQKHSLDHWLEYLTGPDALYPTWFKFFTIKSVLGLAEYDKKEHKFPKRTKSTTGLYPDLNAEALSYVCEFLEKQLKKERVENPIPEPANPYANEAKPVSDDEFQDIISSENFAKYYGFTLEHMTSQKELWPETRGEWRSFNKGEDAQLVKSLQGKGTGWCTAGAGMAENQLSRGEFHVYYSLDMLGQPTVPRLAIRMEGECVAEVRGVEANQNVDPFITPILEEKLPEFGKQGERYMKQAADMRRLTEIDTKAKLDSELTPKDLRFLYEMDDRIVSFRQRGQDPRIKEIRDQREWREDMQNIYTVNSGEELAQKLLADKKSSVLLEHLGSISGLSTETALSFIKTGAGQPVLRNWESFDNLDQVKIVDALIENNHDVEVAENLDKFTSLSQQEIVDKLFKRGSGLTVARNFDVFTEINQGNIYDRLLKKGKTEGIAQNINKFTELDPADIAMDLVKAGSIDVVLSYYESFGKLDDQYFAEYAVGTGKMKDLALSLDKFSSIAGEAVADKLLSQGFGDYVAKNVDVFPDLDRQDIADRLVESGRISGILSSMDKFSNVSLGLEKMGEIFFKNLSDRDPSLRNIGVFSSEFQLRCTKALIERGEELAVAAQIKNLNKEIHKDISLQISNLSLGLHLASIFNQFNSFSEIDLSVAFKLLRQHKSSDVIATIDKYIDLDHQQFIDQLNLEEVADKIHKFKNLNQETFEKLLTTPAKGSGARGVNFDYLLRSIDSFIISDHQSIADKLVDLNQQDKLTENLDKFQNLNPETAKILLPLNSYLVAKNIGKFSGIDRQKIVDEIISLNEMSSISANLSNFAEISQESLEKIITRQSLSDVIQGLRYFDIKRFDQDSLATKFLETESNVYFCGLRDLDKYNFLTKEQLDELNKLPQDMRADAAKKMANANTGV